MKIEPWHKIVKLRPGLAEGVLEMKDLAADLHAVHEGKATKDYLDPKSFFELTYPTVHVGFCTTSTSSAKKEDNYFHTASFKLSFSHFRTWSHGCPGGGNFECSLSYLKLFL